MLNDIDPAIGLNNHLNRAIYSIALSILTQSSFIIFSFTPEHADGYRRRIHYLRHLPTD